MLTAFTAALLLITISELGDKTFFIAVILAMRHSRRLVFIGATAALAAMTVLSVLVGQAVSLLPPNYIHFAEIALFFCFGFKLLYDAKKMSVKGDCEEAQEAAEAVDRSRSFKWLPAGSKLGVVLKTFVLTFIAEWGDRTQIATIALAASNNAFGVTLGAIVGHAICAAIAVIGGRIIAGRISERAIATLGGCLFLIFGTVAYLEGA